MRRVLGVCLIVAAAVWPVPGRSADLSAGASAEVEAFAIRSSAAQNHKQGSANPAP